MHGNSLATAGVKVRTSVRFEEGQKQCQECSVSAVAAATYPPATRRDVVCFGCGQPGHIKSNCPNGGVHCLPLPAWAVTLIVTGVGHHGHVSRFCTTDKPMPSPAPQAACSFVCVSSGSSACKSCIVASLPGVCGRCEFLLDTGSERNILPVSYCSGVPLRPVSAHLTTANGAKLPVLGEKDLMVEIDGILMPVTFWVVEGIETGILGMSFMTRGVSMWDMRERG